MSYPSSSPLLLALFALILIGCSPAPPAESLNAAPFFDLKGFVEQEIEQLQKQQPQARKEVAVNGQQESLPFDSLNYEKELQVFIRSDINRPAWTDKYRADTLLERGQVRALSYEALVEGLKTRLLSIQFTEEGDVKEIKIQNRTQSPVADVRQDLTYTPGSGYRLLTAQSTALSEEKEVEVSVRWE